MDESASSIDHFFSYFDSNYFMKGEYGFLLQLYRKDFSMFAEFSKTRVFTFETGNDSIVITLIYEYIARSREIEEKCIQKWSNIELCPFILLFCRAE